MVVGEYPRICEEFNIDIICQFICSCYEFLLHGLTENQDEKEYLYCLQRNSDIYKRFLVHLVPTFNVSFLKCVEWCTSLFYGSLLRNINC